MIPELLLLCECFLNIDQQIVSASLVFPYQHYPMIPVTWYRMIPAILWSPFCFTTTAVLVFLCDLSYLNWLDTFNIPEKKHKSYELSCKRGEYWMSYNLLLLSIIHNAVCVLTAPVRTVIVRLLLLFRTLTAWEYNNRKLFSFKIYLTHKIKCIKSLCDVRLSVWDIITNCW